MSDWNSYEYDEKMDVDRFYDEAGSLLRRRPCRSPLSLPYEELRRRYFDALRFWISIER